MVLVYCDSCKKKVPEPSRGVNYVTELGLDLCLSCRDDLIKQTGRTLGKRDAYRLKDYRGVYEQTMRRMCK
jgi:hypothetical protein